MAVKLAPPPRKAADKGTPPEREDSRDNLARPEPGRIVALNFRVPADFKRDVKIAAAMAGITQSELLQQAFRLWQQKRG